MEFFRIYAFYDAQVQEDRVNKAHALLVVIPVPERRCVELPAKGKIKYLRLLVPGQIAYVKSCTFITVATDLIVMI